MDDVARAIFYGKFPNSSTGQSEKVDHIAWDSLGDDQDGISRRLNLAWRGVVPGSGEGDTHDVSSIEGANRRIDALAVQVQQILDLLTAPGGSATVGVTGPRPSGGR